MSSLRLLLYSLKNGHKTYQHKTRFGTFSLFLNAPNVDNRCPCHWYRILQTFVCHDYSYRDSLTKKTSWSVYRALKEKTNETRWK